MKTNIYSPCLNPPHNFICSKCGLEVGSHQKVYLHPIQEKIFELIQSKDIDDKISLRKIGKAIGVDSPQKVKHHITQLIRYGYINIINSKYVVSYTEKE